MLKVEIPDFSIEQIANSGQCFRINKIETNVWQVKAFGKVLNIQQIEIVCIFHCSDLEFEQIWTDYFDLRRNYAAIKQEILETEDPFLSAAVKYGYGLRILKQDLWEIVVSFIISQRNNISRIKKTIEKLCKPYGNTFPSAFDLKKYTEQDFKNIGLGYRAKYLVDIIKATTEGVFNFQYLHNLNHQESIEYLKKFNGIGDKIANCISLFGLHKLESFPRDVWINRVIKNQYNGKFNIEQFKAYAGLVQQYIYFYAISSPC
ncbi:MAG: hypothetical protein LBF70_01780 [Holosporales bacterium]|jgi:N-glycosylase/DNA lyase|nr:hypothetical protein [Holosporales bacterium]